MLKLAIVLMVKDESLIIERCLESVIPLADLVIITDTGSTDDTIIKAGLFLQKRNIKYKIYQEPFVDFAWNRTRLINLASKEEVDYVLMIDADEKLVIDKDFDFNGFRNGLNKIAYQIKLNSGGHFYHLPRLTSNKAKLKYDGVTHECMELGHIESPKLVGFYIEQMNDSYRRLSNKKFSDDIILLKHALLSEKRPEWVARYTFYLAQSLEASAHFEEAKFYYKERINQEGWWEEKFYSYYRLGHLYFRENNKECIFYFLTAWHTDPRRAEPLVLLINWLNTHNGEKYIPLIISELEKMPMPDSGLFIEKDLYSYAK